MDTFLKSLQNKSVQTNVYGFVVSILLSLFCSIVVSLLYYTFFENRRRGSQAHRFFIIGGPAITAMLIAIQFSLPLSLGLLGALSFIRFRTPIKEPEEVAYIMLLIALSISCATFNYIIVTILLVIAVIALVFQKFLPFRFLGTKKNGIVLLSFAEEEFKKCNNENEIEKTIKSLLPKAKLDSISTSEGFVSCHYGFESKSTYNINYLLSQIREKLNPLKLDVFFGE